MNKFLILLLIIIVIYSLAVISVVLREYYSFEMGNPHDFALHHHALWNTSNGNLLKTNIFSLYRPFSDWNLLKDHYYLVILLLAPLYGIFREGSFLLIFQSIALLIASVPVFLLGKTILKNNKWAFFVAIIYLFYPMITKLFFLGSRMEYYAIPLLFWAFYAIERNKMRNAFICLLIAGLCKEEVLIAVCMIGVYVFFKKNVEQRFKYGFILIVVSVSMLIAFIFLIPKWLGLSYIGNRMLGDSGGIVNDVFKIEYLKGLFSAGKVEYFIYIFKTLCFIPFLSPAILLSVPFFIINLLFDEYAVVNHLWHSVLIVPFLFLSFIYGLNLLLKIIKHPYGQRLIGIILFVFFLNYGGKEVIESIGNPLSQSKIHKGIKPDVYKEYQDIINRIPKEASLFVQFCFLPNLSNRDNIYWLKNVLPTKDNIDVIPTAEQITVDYVFYSPEILKDKYFKEEKELIYAVEKEGKYKVDYESRNFRLLKRPKDE